MGHLDQGCYKKSVQEIDIVKAPLSYAPLLPVLLTFIGGIILERYIQVPYSHIIIVIPVIAGLITIRHSVYILLLALSATIGYSCSNLSSPSNYIPSCNSHQATVLRVNESMMSSRAIVQLSHNRRCYLVIPDRFPQPSPGDIIQFYGTLRQPAMRRDVNTDPDLSSFLYRNYINISSTADSIEITSHSKSFKWRVYATRDKLVDTILNSGISDSSKELLCAMLWGDTSIFTSEKRTALSQAGLSHILAISGLHVAILAAIISILLFPLSMGGMECLRHILLIIILWCYAILTGLSPSVTRAVIMITVVLTGKIINRGGTTLNSLCLAAIIILAFDPRAIYSPGFQLTMVAVATISLVSKTTPAISSQSGWIRTVISWAIITVAATIGTSLLSIYHFNTFPPYFLLANIPIALLLLPLIVSGLILTALSTVGLELEILNRLIDWMSSLIFRTSNIATSLPGGVADDLHITVWGTIAGYMAILTLIAAMYYKKYQLLCSIAIILATIPIFSSTQFARPDAELFISRNRDATSIVIADKDGIKFKATNVPALNRHIANSLRLSHPGFFKRHKALTATPVGNRHEGMGWAADGRIISFGNTNLAVINSINDLRPSPVKIDYAIIGRGYNGDITDIATTLQPDTILLGTDINGRRRSNYIKALTNSQRPFRSLSDGYGLYLKL